MKTEPERQDDALVDAALGGEPWVALHAEVKRAALAAFRARQRRRQALAWSARLAACFLAVAGAAWWWSGSSRIGLVAQAPARAAAAASRSAAKAAQSPTSAAPALPAGPYISEAELLALFPPGSCMMAEIDGERRLIFLDPKIAAEGVEMRKGS